MAPFRRVLFVVYAVGSWVYRWVVMFGILWFLADFMGPKLKILSQMLAIMSLASIFIWPSYKMIKNIRQRGRLPDMKRPRVVATMTVAAGLVAAFFLVPLPVGRVHETGLVTTDSAYATAVTLPEPGRLVELAAVARPGRVVRKGERLARFDSEPLEVELAKAEAELAEYRQTADGLERAVGQAGGEASEAVDQLRQQARDARQKERAAADEAGLRRDRKARLAEVVAPRDGVVGLAPRPDEQGKMFDRGYAEAQPVFTVGDPTRLIVRVPVDPQTFRVLSDDLPAKGGELAATILVKGRSDREFAGVVRRLPVQNAANVPVQLTQRGGGPLAVKPSQDPNQLIPLAQTYLIEVELTDPDAAVRPGQLASVKVHTRWRSAAWWVGQTLANALDIGLY